MNHRISRVKELIKRELGTILERNFTFNGSLVTIHDVDVTPDLKQCFVYVGILGKEHAAPNIIRKLNEGRGMIQRDLYKRVILKSSPSLTFKFDNSIERGVRILSLIENLPEPLPDLEPDAGQEPSEEDKNAVKDEDLPGDDEGDGTDVPDKPAPQPRLPR
ncbi:MAG: 30S ribosome-binding factor RbfA [Verrucomicrobium sp.]|nr:30S ribosome-binding factor RbfA [Verrucomicrobium sp.]